MRLYAKKVSIDVTDRCPYYTNFFYLERRGEMKKLAGKIAVVTGASRGIGKGLR